MQPTVLAPLLPDRCLVGDGGICIGRYSLRELADAHGTPLYVYDAATLRSSARRVRDALEPLGARLSYAAKACAIGAVLRTLEGCGLNLDVVSLGELTAGLRAGFGAERIHLHGNVKTDVELEAAVHAGVHAIVVDSAGELRSLERICERMGRPARVMLRMQLPLEAETHSHLNTSGRGSKFGIARSSEEEENAVRALGATSRLRFVGLHTHLGSQILDAGLYRRAAQQLVDAVREFARQGLESRELSLGGGWAVPYRPGDGRLSPLSVAEAVSDALSSLPGVEPAFEPGRALVARSAVAIYRVGSVKRAPAGRIVAVDGGMGDNPRPALYGAAYTALHADRPLAPSEGPADVVGRYCESGDILARGVPLPDVAVGDLICVPVSGAYQLAMAGGYNLVPPPAALLADGDDILPATRRATVEDLLSRDL